MQLRLAIARIKIWWQQLYWTHKYVGRRVVFSKDYIKKNILDNETMFEAYNDGRECEYDGHEYDQLVMLSMCMAMNIPVWSDVKGVGLDCLLCYFTADGMTHWGYYDPKDLVFLD